MSGRVLVAGIGNIFLGDDGFGVEVAQRMRQQPPRDHVRIEDFGIRGLHLAYELLDGYQCLVLVDAMPMGERAGSVALVEVDPVEPTTADDAGVLESHSLDPVVVLDLVAHLGGAVERVVVVGCEPESLDDGIGLSPSVASAVDCAIDAIDHLLDELCAPRTGMDAKEICP
jgi:hydrogenase maturation protease